MEEYIDSIIRVGKILIGSIMVVFVLWYIVKDIVQLINQFESFTDTIPPVTTLPLNGSLLQIFSIYGGILSSNVVTVADSQFVFDISIQNLSGCPNSSLCLTSFLHNSQHAPSPFSIVKSGALSWSPSIDFSVQLPFVTNTKSFTVKLIVSSFPSCMQIICFAVFFFPSISNNTFVTFVSY